MGGYPKGRVVEIYGPESSGKTTLAIHAIAEAQKAGGIAAFIDAEHAFDSFYAQKLGVDVDNLLISQPDNGEQALEIADSLIRSSAIDIIVIDSVAALTPKAEIEGEMGCLLYTSSVLIADNILWSGKVVQPIAHNDRHTQAVMEFNRMVREDPRVENVIVPVSYTHLPTSP